MKTARKTCRKLGGTENAAGAEAKKYLTFAGILLLIREVRCGILLLSDG